MTSEERYVGERLCLKGQNCTVRYIGTVRDKAGTWLGVEWDDPNRGKHNGTHDGTVYFTCRSKSPTAASFLRPTQQWDPPRTFLQAVREKYMPEFHEDDAQIVYFSGKQAEEIGFEKFHQRQAKLQGIHVLVLDHMRIKHSPDDLEAGAVREICADIVELDLSGNLFGTIDEVLQLCRLLPKLRVLTLDGNRLSVDVDREYPSFRFIRTLSLSRTLLGQTEVNKVASCFPDLHTLTLADNEFDGLLRLNLPLSIWTVDLSDNQFAALSDLEHLNVNCPMLHTLILKRNKISAINTSNDPDFDISVVELDLSYNAITNWSFFNNLTQPTCPNLKHLRVTGNPIYQDLTSTDGKPLAAEDGYMLTIARSPQLESLNYSKVTEKERLNAETYYLGQIAIELSNTPEEKRGDVIARHPRYADLCAEYGEPAIQQKTSQEQFNPNSLAARLVTITFSLTPNVLPHITQRTWTEEVPKSLDIYALLGLVGKRLGVLPLDLHLVLESDERDPVGRDSGYGGPEEWDSSDDEGGADGEGGEWVKRELELVAGTRAVGTYVEGREARVRVGVRS